MWAEELIVLSEHKPDALDLINEDELGRFSAEALNIPKQIVNSVEQVEEIRQLRQEQMEEQLQAEKLRQGLEIANLGADAAQKAGITQGHNGSVDRKSAISRSKSTNT